MMRLNDLLKEIIKGSKVICDCGHSWDLSDGGKDKYICHKCGVDNNPMNEADVNVGHENDRDMVVGVAEIVRMVDDMDNRKKIAGVMLKKFKAEDTIHNVKEFLTMCGISQ